MLKPIEEFQDKIFDLEQYRQETGTSKAALLESPDCAAVVGEMELLVQEYPEIVNFYAGCISKYRKNHPEKVKEEIGVIKGRIDLMEDEGLFTPHKFGKLTGKLETGELVVEEATVFFNMFRKIIPRSELPDLNKLKPKSKEKKRGPRQAKEIHVVIGEDDEITINGKELDDLSDIQRLIIFSGLAKDGRFRHVEIYNTKAFSELKSKDDGDISNYEAYVEEFTKLRDMLQERRLSRLIDPQKMPGLKSHVIAATSLVDKRIEAARQKRWRKLTGHRDSSAIEEFEKERDSGGSLKQSQIDREAEVADEDSDIDTELMPRARTLLLELIRQATEGIGRGSVIQAISKDLNIDNLRAGRLVSQVKAEESEKEHPAFLQVRNGSKKFVASEYIDEDEVEEVPNPFGEYFEGSVEDFKKRYGIVKGVTASFVNYERGVINFKDLELALVSYFFANPDRKALAQKTIIYQLQQAGVEATSKDLKQAVDTINNLSDKEFLILLPAASRAEAVKGPRIQLRGSFMEMPD